MQDADKQNRPG
jgi:2'-5' RNA ligase